jgi:hypothetical protein
MCIGDCFITTYVTLCSSCLSYPSQKSWFRQSSVLNCDVFDECEYMILFKWLCDRYIPVRCVHPVYHTNHKNHGSDNYVSWTVMFLMNVSTWCALVIVSSSQIARCAYLVYHTNHKNHGSDNYVSWTVMFLMDVSTLCALVIVSSLHMLRCVHLVYHNNQKNHGSDKH